MFDCLWAGDSIAVMTSYYKPECAKIARGGYNSWQYNKYFPGPLQAKTVVISLGTNDHDGVFTEIEIEAVRARVSAQRVVWILPPIKPNIQAIVRRVAAAHGDGIVLITSFLPGERPPVHPDAKGSRQIVQDVWGQ